MKTKALFGDFLIFKSLCTLEWISHPFPVSGPVSVDQRVYSQTPGVEPFRTHFADHWFWVCELDSSFPF